MHCFSVMMTERPILPSPQGGYGGMCAIPYSKIVLYATEAGWDRETRRWFVNTMLVLDSLWREHKREEAEKAQKKAVKEQTKQAKRAAQEVAGARR